MSKVEGNVRARETARGIREWSILPELARPCRRVMQNKDENQAKSTREVYEVGKGRRGERRLCRGQRAGARGGRGALGMVA